MPGQRSPLPGQGACLGSRLEQEHEGWAQSCSPTVERGGGIPQHRAPWLGWPWWGSSSAGTAVGGSSIELRQELSGDGARKDVTSQAHVKVAIYKQVIARVTTQLSLRQRRILLFISPPFARCSNARPCPQAEQQRCCLPASTTVLRYLAWLRSEAAAFFPW